MENYNRHSLYDESEKAINNFKIRFFEKYSPDSLKLPKVLYHYTSSEGIKGIIESGCFWATHFRFLNDQTEILYSMDLIDNEMDYFISSITNNYLKEILEKYKNVRERWINIYKGFNHDVYIASFTEKEDMKSQWKEYGEKAKGYVIGIDPNRLLNLRMDKPIYNISNKIGHFWLVKIDYDKEKQKDIIRKYFKHFETTLSNTEVFNDPNEKRTFYENAVLDYLLFLINYLPLLFKNPFSKEENEWRFFQIRNPKNNNIEFRNAGNEIKPYAVFDFRMSEQESLMPIKEIIYGPKLDEIKSNEVFEKLLTKYGYYKKNKTLPKLKKSNIKI